MRVVVQRVSEASVRVDETEVASIGRGLCILVGVAVGDGPGDVETMALKIAGLRIFPDDESKMNLSVLDVGGEALLVSQFTLLGDARKGRRPSFIGAADPMEAEPLVRVLADRLADLGVPTQQGVFGAHMHVGLVNDGPVTILLDVRQGSVI